MQNHMLRPKPPRRRRARILPPDQQNNLGAVLGRLAPPERRAMAQICETADLLMVDGAAFLLVPADDRLLGTLSSFGAELQDIEPDVDAEDDDPAGNPDDEAEPWFGDRWDIVDPIAGRMRS